MTLRLALRSHTKYPYSVNRTTGHAVKNYKIAITLVNLLKLALAAKRRLHECVLRKRIMCLHYNATANSPWRTNFYPEC